MKNKQLKINSIILLSLFLMACQTIPTNNKQFTKPEGYVSSTDSVQIYYTKTAVKSENTLVFIHCWGCNGTYWEAQIKYFAKSHQVITLDLAGHGLSGADRDNFTIEKFADDVVAVVKTLGLSNIVLVGHSLGAAVAIETSLKAPDQVKGIITVDTFATGNQWPDESEIERVMIPFRKAFYKMTYPRIKSRFAPHTDKSLIYRIAKDISLAPPDIGTNSLENLYRWIASDFQNARSKLTVPLIHINSRQSNTPRNSTEKILYVQSAGHFIPLEAPKKFNTVLDQALEILTIH